jgi:hypothetical protein
VSGFVSVSALFVPSIYKAYRAIGPFTATVTIRERGRDELVITEEPVETGAAISDHAYKRPAEVTIEVGFNAASNPQNVYAQFLSLQAQRQPFTVYTGKRMYQTMLIAEIDVETDESTEYVLMATIICRQIILVSTSTVQTPTLNATNMTMPQQTAPSQSQGTQQAVPTNAFSPSVVAAP